MTEKKRISKFNRSFARRAWRNWFGGGTFKLREKILPFRTYLKDCARQ
jgi:hypothetical protein